jgi:DNA-binding NarL/FixJ family response regulator
VGEIIDFTKDIAEITRNNPLTRKETQVLNLLANGLNVKEMAEEMGITVNSLNNNYFKRIYSKLQLIGNTPSGKSHIAVSKVLKQVAQRSS